MEIQKDIAFDAFDNFEVKFDEETKTATVKGYASTFGNIDFANDVIEKGAFGNLTPNKIKMLYQHNSKDPIGVFTSIHEDERGLFVEGKISDTTLGRDVSRLLKDGALDAFSIGFTIPPKGVKYDEKGIRYITKAKLMEVSVVTFPANDKARITSVKNMSEQGCFETIRDFERGLRSVGFSQTESSIIASKSYPTLEQHWDGVNKKDSQRDVEALTKLINELKGK